MKKIIYFIINLVVIIAIFTIIMFFIGEATRLSDSELPVASIALTIIIIFIYKKIIIPITKQNEANYCEKCGIKIIK
ncbi:MAG: hypothetical protein WC905_00500 [Patescibacteria group bacterium]|jgi:hypothetical protein